MQRKIRTPIKIALVIILIPLLIWGGLKIYNTMFPVKKDTDIIDNNHISSLPTETPEIIETEPDITAEEPETKPDIATDEKPETSPVAKPSVVEGDSFYFYNKTDQYNRQFIAENMMPGDFTAVNYAVKVSHIGPVELSFKVNVKEGKLSEKLMVKLSCNDEVVAEDNIKDFEYKFTLNSKKAITDIVDYRFEVYLPTDTGNEYQNTKAVADFVWSVKELNINGEQGKVIVDTSVRGSNTAMFSGLAILGMVMIILGGAYYEKTRK